MIRSLTSRRAPRRWSRTVPAGLSAVAVAGLAGVLLVSGGAPPASSGDLSIDDEPGTFAQFSEGSDADADADGEEIAIPLPLETIDVELTRDPFEPVVPEPEPEPGPDAVDGDGDGDPDDPASDDPDDPFNGTSPPSEDVPAPGATGGCFGDEEVVCDGRVVSLLGFESIDGETAAIIRVGSTRYVASEGERFRDELLLESIDEPCVTLRHIEGDLARVCVTDPQLK